MGEIPMRRRISRILIGAALCACLICSGCSEKIREGEIYEKEYKPEKTIVNIVPIIHTNGKTASATYIPMIYHYPDRWCVRIRSFEKMKTGNMRRHNITRQRKSMTSAGLEISSHLKKIETWKMSR